MKSKEGSPSLGGRGKKKGGRFRLVISLLKSDRANVDHGKKCGGVGFSFLGGGGEKRKERKDATTESSGKKPERFQNK